MTDRHHKQDPAALTADDDARDVFRSVEERLAGLSEHERLIFTLVCQHIGSLGVAEPREPSAFERRIDAVETAITDIRGESGSNGKLGALKERFDKVDARRWWLLTFVAGLIVTTLGSAIAFGRWMSSIETDVDWLKARTLRAPPMSSPRATEETP